MRADLQYRDDTRVIEVRVFAGDRLIALELCEDEHQAADIVDRWSELPEISVLVDDYSCLHPPVQVVAPDRTVMVVDAPIASAALSGVGWE